MQPLLEILSIQNVAIILAKRVIYPNSSEYIFTKEPVVKGFTISGTSELELKSNTSEKIQQAQEAVRLAKIAQDLTTKLQELVQTKQLHPRSPLTGGLDNQSHGEQIHVNVIEAEVALNEHFDIQFESNKPVPSPIIKVETSTENNLTITAPDPGIKQVKPLTKKSVMKAFDDVYWSYDQWSKYLASPPQWLIPCRVAKGNKSVSATWSPVLIGLALIDKGVTLKRLDLVFMGLKDWKDEWQEKTDLMR